MPIFEKLKFFRAWPGWPRLRSLLGVRAGLIMFMLALAASLAAMPKVITSTEETMNRATRNDIAWIGVHGREEFQHLVRTVTAMVADLSPGRESEVALAYEIVISRLETWRNGAFSALLRNMPDRLEALEAAGIVIRALAPQVQKVAEPGAARRLLTALEEVEPELDRLSRQVFTAASDDIQAHQAKLRTLQTVQMVLIMGLLATGCLFVVLLLRQNFLLKRANAAERATAAENAFLASHDALTRLPNRTTIHSSLTSMLAAATPEASVAVLMIDLDGFKPINDILGHKAGDALLTSVASCLSQAVAVVKGGMAGRLGGDEFVVVAPLMDDEAALQRLVGGIGSALGQPHAVDGHQVSVTATIGYVLAGDSALPAAEMLNRADLALTRAKMTRKGQACGFEAAMDDELAARRQIESDLAEADIGAEIEPFYQPIVDLASGRIVAVEALARWRHPQRGMISPVDFIPVAESSGRIVDIGRIMLEKACRDAMRMPDHVSVAVNVSAVQLLRMDVPTVVFETLSSSGLEPSRLKLEITESAMIGDANSTRDLLLCLRAMGVRVALDDFGTGYSSLSYLKGFSFDELKIDRSFIVALQSDQRSMAIVHTIVSLARNLDMTIVAEGIEELDQATLLEAAGCVRGQGYYFGRPVPIEALLNQFFLPNLKPLNQIAC
jgi:diguanylate cyclase (GGDEF)-like protein